MSDLEDIKREMQEIASKYTFEFDKPDTFESTLVKFEEAVRQVYDRAGYDIIELKISYDDQQIKAEGIARSRIVIIDIITIKDRNEDDPEGK